MSKTKKAEPVKVKKAKNGPSVWEKLQGYFGLMGVVILAARCVQLEAKNEYIIFGTGMFALTLAVMAILKGFRK